MPFESKRQMRWMFANHPEMAKRWADHTPAIGKLPETAKKKPKPSQFPETGSAPNNDRKSTEKEATMHWLDGLAKAAAIEFQNVPASSGMGGQLLNLQGRPSLTPAAAAVAAPPRPPAAQRPGGFSDWYVNTARNFFNPGNGYPPIRPQTPAPAAPPAAAAPQAPAAPAAPTAPKAPAPREIPSSSVVAGMPDKGTQQTGTAGLEMGMPGNSGSAAQETGNSARGNPGLSGGFGSEVRATREARPAPAAFQGQPPPVMPGVRRPAATPRPQPAAPPRHPLLTYNEATGRPIGVGTINSTVR